MLVKISVSLLLFGLITGCQTTAVNTSFNSNYKDYDKNGLVVKRKVISKRKAIDGDAWQLTRNHLAFSESYNKARVVEQISTYNRYPLHMTKASKQASPYYHYVLQEVIKRGFPSEVALLPIIESMYDPKAYSTGKASGIWQIIPSTATYLGIEINDWYDGRRDVITSTKTALDYLASLNKRFKGDWMLTFAAYNSGGGTVSKAIRKNKEQNLATDYWSLALPRETTDYVPRILAIAALVDNPQQFNIKLPSIANVPYFEVVKLPGQIDLNKVAKISGVSKDIIDKLNPGFNRNVTSPSGPHRILVPVNKAAKLEIALKNLDKSERLNWQHYTVVAGDSIGLIAQRFNIPVTMLKETNSMRSSRIRIGKTLLIPTFAATRVAQRGAILSGTKTSQKHTLHTINNGDTVWEIAKKHKLSVKVILAFNGLSKNSTLRVGTSIKIPRG
ncbi:MAG: transglycosylase SLT domain-containing protein [Oceanospirillaceae bacterium]|nr:transglycosylase SLT domain-containing protein [Oceanospirillaceae bacterium]